MATINELTWTSLTAAINEIKSPNQFLRRLLFGNHQPQSTELIEIGVFTGSRQIAPFVRKNGAAVMVEGHGQTFQAVEAPNIRIKRPFTPSDLLFGRKPGTVIFSPSAQYQVSAAQAHIARDMQMMADSMTNAEEYLSALAIRGAISYSVTDQEVFTITYPKPAGNNVTLTTFWDDATPANVHILNDIYTAAKLVADETGLTVTDCVLGSEAAAQFRTLIDGGNVKALNQLNVIAGTADFTQQFRDDGALYLGQVGGVRFWEYSRTALLDGVATPMIRAKYAEFFAVTPAAQNVMYYGAIADADALNGMLFQGERFSKSWIEKDPSQIIALAHSRPLPVPRRPGSMVSMKVISG